MAAVRWQGHEQEACLAEEVGRCTYGLLKVFLAARIRSLYVISGIPCEPQNIYVEWQTL